MNIQYTDEVRKILDSAPVWVQEAIETGIRDRASARELADQAEELKTTADDALGVALEFLGLDKVETGLGTLSRKTSTRTSYDAAAISQYLVTHGVSARVASNAIEAGAKTTEFTSLEFRLPRVNGNGKKAR